MKKLLVFKGDENPVEDMDVLIVIGDRVIPFGGYTDMDDDGVRESFKGEMEDAPEARLLSFYEHNTAEAYDIDLADYREIQTSEVVH